MHTNFAESTMSSLDRWIRSYESPEGAGTPWMGAEARHIGSWEHYTDLGHVKGIPNDWGRPSNPLDKTVKYAGIIADYKGPDSLPADSHDAFKLAVQKSGAEGVVNFDIIDVARKPVGWRPLERVSPKGALRLSPDEAVFFVAYLAAQGAELHLKIEKKKPTVGDLGFSSYNDLIAEGVITEDDLPFLLKWNPAARRIPGQPAVEKIYLQAVGEALGSIMPKINSIRKQLAPESEHYMARILDIWERIPESDKERMRQGNGPAFSGSYQYNENLKSSISKVDQASKYILGENARIENIKIGSSGSFNPVGEIAGNWVLNILKSGHKLANWIVNVDVGDADNKFGPITWGDVQNIKHAARVSYRQERDANHQRNKPKNFYQLFPLRHRNDSPVVQDPVREQNTEPTHQAAVIKGVGGAKIAAMDGGGGWTISDSKHSTHPIATIFRHGNRYTASFVGDQHCTLRITYVDSHDVLQVKYLKKAQVRGEENIVTFFASSGSTVDLEVQDG
ncbi:hypothetical protein ABT071_22050 [Streptomyces sp. NPDC002506]|uniref:hypothetical protein n=1 Tax=Streptomyces sp. NPDC002506 TaxID=3154536 RepID=UPI003325D4EA